MSGASLRATWRWLGGMAPPLLSLVLPGLGQVAAGRKPRGLLLLTGTLGLAILAVYEGLPGLLVGPGLLWGWGVWDAFAGQQGYERRAWFPVLVAALTTYAIAWQVTQINLGRLVRDFPQARTVLLALVQPNVLTRDVRANTGIQAILVPCPPGTEAPPGPSRPVATSP